MIDWQTLGDKGSVLYADCSRVYKADELLVAGGEQEVKLHLAFYIRTSTERKDYPYQLTIEHKGVTRLHMPTEAAARQAAEEIVTALWGGLNGRGE